MVVNTQLRGSVKINMRIYLIDVIPSCIMNTRRQAETLKGENMGKIIGQPELFNSSAEDIMAAILIDRQILELEKEIVYGNFRTCRCKARRPSCCR